MIRVENITKSFDENEILKGISTEFKKGKTNLIIGQSGSGKTVFLKCLLGLFKIDSGNIRFEGKMLKEMNIEERSILRQEMGMVFQGSALFDSMSVEENIMFPMQMFTKKIDSEIRVFKVENAFIIAFLCALLNLIPYLGPIIGGLLMMTLTMSSFIGADFSSVILPKTSYVMIGFVIGQLIDNFFSQPFIFSNSVKSHPLEIFIVILASGTLLGPVGMIIAIPLYTTLKVISQEFLAENKIVKSLTKNF